MRASAAIEVWAQVYVRSCGLTKGVSKFLPTIQFKYSYFFLIPISLSENLFAGRRAGRQKQEMSTVSFAFELKGPFFLVRMLSFRKCIEKGNFGAILVMMWKTVTWHVLVSMKRTKVTFKQFIVESDQPGQRGSDEWRQLTTRGGQGGQSKDDFWWRRWEGVKCKSRQSVAWGWGSPLFWWHDM